MKKLKPWFEYIPHALIMVFSIIVLAGILSYLIPAGTFDREMVDGRQRVIAGTYHTIEQTPLSLMELFLCIPLGFKTAVDIIFVVLASGIMFGILEKTGMIENAIGTLLRRLGIRRRLLLVVLMTFLFGMLGVFVGYENNIALIPIAALVVLALGGDLMLAAGIAVGGVTVGFGLSPFNPYTVGTAHKIAELPLFSGAALRGVLCLAGLTLLSIYNVRYFQKIRRDPSKSLSAGIDTQGFVLSKAIDQYRMSVQDSLLLGAFLTGLGVMLFGIFNYHWYINEISAIFLMVAVAAGVISRMNGQEYSLTVLKSIGVVAPGAFMVGFATTIKIVLEQGNISDTVAFQLTGLLNGLPIHLAAVGMSVVQTLINFMIPSGSGQALATMPIMVPTGELLGLTRQTTVLAFQIGDGVANLINPALGGLIAMLSMVRIPFDRWLRFAFRITLYILLLSWCFLVLSVWINWGPA
ncbi:MAG TPA: AbgT family transporter [Saprospiraceae bacterium]|nr:AbgT family transporter [Saprospiraceae bacterium]HMQ81674.1 AbgT family transporter [Saprospiraceae bacterium]